jgi:hypothetical protein
MEKRQMKTVESEKKRIAIQLRKPVTLTAANLAVLGVKLATRYKLAQRAVDAEGHLLEAVVRDALLKSSRLKEIDARITARTLDFQALDVIDNTLLLLEIKRGASNHDAGKLSTLVRDQGLIPADALQKCQSWDTPPLSVRFGYIFIYDESPKGLNIIPIKDLECAYGVDIQMALIEATQWLAAEVKAVYATL